MKNKYPHIFEPITVRRMTVKNRIVMTPMGTNYGEQNGEMSFLTSTTMSREQRAALVSSSLRMQASTLRRVQT